MSNCSFAVQLAMQSRSLPKYGRTASHTTEVHSQGVTARETDVEICAKRRRLSSGLVWLMHLSQLPEVSWQLSNALATLSQHCTLASGPA